MEISRVHNLMKKALDARALRQDLISSNISNVTTPFYRPKDINFENALSKEAKKIFTKHQKPKLNLAKTHKDHMGGLEDEEGKNTIFYRDGHQARNDGNSVDLDVETTEMSKNQIMFKALTASVKKEALLFKSVLQSSEKLN